MSMSSLTTKQHSNFNGFPKAAELIEIEGAHALEASDRAMFNQLLQTAHDSGRLTEPDVEWEISLAALRRASTKHESNDRIRDSLRRLRRTEVRVTYVSARTGLTRTMETHLLEFTDTDDVDSPVATVQFGIPKRLRAVLARSNRWGRIRCEVSYAMTSKYAIALYEMVCLRANLDRCVENIEMGRFRELLGVPPGAYDRADNFMRNVVTPALLEVNGLSDISVQIEMVRRHPRAPAHAVALAWWRKSGDEFRDAMQERNRSKVGRMARLKGKVESVDTLEDDRVAEAHAELAMKLDAMRAKEREERQSPSGDLRLTLDEV
jgi:Initiator Replication protein